MRVVVYIDGFNLDDRSLMGTPYEGLDLDRLADAAMPNPGTVDVVNDDTARIWGRVDPTAAARQEA